jgi:hypothetical protein
MKNLIKIVVLLLTLLLLFACFRPDPEPEPECKKYVDEFYPISEGNTWLFEKLWYDNSEIDSARIDTRSYVIGTTGIISFEDSIHTTGMGYWYAGISEVKFNGLGGLYYAGLVYGDTIWYYSPQLYYKYPVDVGETWQIKTTSVGFYFLDTLDMSCVAKDHVYITSTDTFLTTVYHHSSEIADDVSNRWHLFEYFSYGVGLVGYDIYSTSDIEYNFDQRNIQDLFIAYKLIDYCLY